MVVMHVDVPEQKVMVPTSLAIVKWDKKPIKNVDREANTAVSTTAKPKW